MLPGVTRCGHGMRQTKPSLRLCHCGLCAVQPGKSMLSTWPITLQAGRQRWHLEPRQQTQRGRGAVRPKGCRRRRPARVGCCQVAQRDLGTPGHLEASGPPPERTTPLVDVQVGVMRVHLHQVQAESAQASASEQQGSPLPDTQQALQVRWPDPCAHLAIGQELCYAFCQAGLLGHHQDDHRGRHGANKWQSKAEHWSPSGVGTEPLRAAPPALAARSRALVARWSLDGCRNGFQAACTILCSGRTSSGSGDRFGTESCARLDTAMGSRSQNEKRSANRQWSARWHGRQRRQGGQEQRRCMPSGLISGRNKSLSWTEAVNASNSGEQGAQSRRKANMRVPQCST